MLTVPIAYDLFRMPLPRSETLDFILEARHSPSAVALFQDKLGSNYYLRPLWRAEIKLLSDLSRGHYRVAFRTTHVALVVVAIWLFVRALRVRTASGAAAAAFGLTVFTGIHSFAAVVGDTLPISHFLEGMVLCLVALNLALAERPGWHIDIGAALTFACASLIIESGLLVWLVIVSAWIVGLRGISSRGVIAVSGLLACYVILRVAILHTGSPGLTERSTGFWLTVLDPPDIERRFADNAIPFYVYNVFASIASVLFSEPQGGLWVAVRAWTTGDVPPRVVIALLSSASTTILIAAMILDRRSQVDERSAEERRLLFVCIAIIVGNGIVSYGYTRDQIVGIAGAFYALAAAIAARRILDLCAISRWRARQIAVTVLLGVASCTWGIRATGLHYSLLVKAFKQQHEWTETSKLEASDESDRRLIRSLQSKAFGTRVVNPHFIPRWQGRWFDE